MRDALEAEPLLAARRVDPPPPPLLAPLVTPPLAPDEAEGLDLILEGFLLHHGRARQVRPEDRGRAVLAGDYLYAHGLVRVARSADLFVIQALADLIALSAGLVAAGRRGALAPLWRATTAAIAGPGEARADYALAVAALRADHDASQVARIGAGLPATPGLEEAMRARSPG